MSETTYSYTTERYGNIDNLITGLMIASIRDFPKSRHKQSLALTFRVLQGYESGHPIVLREFANVKVNSVFGFEEMMKSHKAHNIRNHQGEISGTNVDMNDFLREMVPRSLGILASNINNLGLVSTDGKTVPPQEQIATYKKPYFTIYGDPDTWDDNLIQTMQDIINNQDNVLCMLDVIGTAIEDLKSSK